ncbi:MAG: PQQ-binding-like beta-propeller repeat protein [Vicinamibacterales bacterium]
MSVRPAAIIVVLAVTLLIVSLPAAAQTSPQDYTQWRGASRDGSAAAFADPGRWPERLALKWRVEVGQGYGTPLIVGDRVYTLTRQGGDEVMAARRVDTGAIIWETRYPAPHAIMTGARAHGQGPKSTPLFFDGRLYTMGITGIISCFDASDGTLRWQKPAPPNETLYNNSAMSPIVDRGDVIFHVGGHDRGALTKFDAVTGAVRWAWDGDGPAYASPIIAELGGTRQVVAMTQRHIVGVSADSGKLLWERPWVNQFSNHSISPILYRDTIIMTGYEMGVVAFRPRRSGDTWTTDTVWEARDVSVFMSNPVLVGETLYGLSQRNSGQFFTMDARTGRVLWLGKGREATNTAIVKANDTLFLLNDDGELIVAKSNPAGLEVIRRYQVAENETWAQPTISGNRIVIKDLTTLALYTVN